PAAGVAAGIGSFLAGIAILALLATLAASIAPVGIEALRDEISLRPFRTFGLGFLALAALVGSGVIIGLTVVGLLIVPAIVLATLLIGFAGCVTAVYMLGSSLYEWRTRREPDRPRRTRARGAGRGGGGGARLPGAFPRLALHARAGDHGHGCAGTRGLRLPDR